MKHTELNPNNLRKIQNALDDYNKIKAEADETLKTIEQLQDVAEPLIREINEKSKNLPQNLGIEGSYKIQVKSQLIIVDKNTSNPDILKSLDIIQEELKSLMPKMDNLMSILAGKIKHIDTLFKKIKPEAIAK